MTTKNILATYASLNTKEADAFLKKTALKIKEEVWGEDKNEEIIKQLELLEEFAYKVPDIVVEIIELIIKKPLKPTLFKTKMGNFKGKRDKDVILKSISLLSHIRYISSDGVLLLLEELFRHSEPEVISKSKDLLKHLSEYNLQALRKIGYAAQDKVLGHISPWPSKKKLANFDYIEVVTRELLSSSAESTQWTKEDTLTFSTGAVVPSDALKKIRRETIDLLASLFKKTKEASIKIKIVNLLEEAGRTPGSVLCGDDLGAMIAEDGKYLIAIYRDMIFDKKGKMVGILPVIAEIDERLHYFQKHSLLKSPEAEALKNDIASNEFYSLFRVLAGNDILYREQEGWDIGENKRSQAIDNHISSITESNLEKWETQLNEIASYKGVINDWQYGHFKLFLRKFSQYKPELASILLREALEEDRPLKQFTVDFLEGFRKLSNFDLWDRFTDQVISLKDPILTSAIAYSLIPEQGAELGRSTRQRDLDLLNEIINKHKRFTYLKHNKGNFNLRHAIINALIANYRRKPILVEKLIVKEFKSNSDSKRIYFSEITTGLWRKVIDFNNWSKAGINFIKKELIEVADLDWHIQQILLDMGEQDLNLILDVFMGRIKKNDETKSKRRNFEDYTRYEAIPYHFNEKLSSFIKDHPKSKKIISKWFEKATVNWSTYNWDVSHFLERVGISRKEVLMPLIKTGTDTNLKKAANLMTSLDGGDPELCMEIVRRTDNKKIHSKVYSLLYSTGVVSGEDGLARAYEAKAKNLEKYNKDKSTRVRKFVEEMTKSFTASAELEYKRAQEEKQLRKIEFGG